MASPALFQSVAGGLVDCRLWTSPLEGAFTMAAKIALVNALDPRTLCELLFGRKLLQTSYAQVHGRSFVDSTWVSSKARATTAQAVIPGFLSSQCGFWAPQVASDARLRLCRRCADVGYQCTFFQIEALSTCPIHGEVLVDTCGHCGAPTPRYALCPEAFEAPMQCPACGVGYGRAWNGTADFASWTGPPDVKPLKRLASHVRSWHSSQLEWPTVAAWIDGQAAERALDRASDQAPDHKAPRRTHIFHALMTRSAAVRADCTVSSWTDPCVSTELVGRWRDEWPRVAVYKSIWRHVVKRLRLSRHCKGFDFDKQFYLHRVNEAIVPKHADCPPSLHAFVLWTKRCEVGDSHRLLRWRCGRTSTGHRHALQLHRRLLLWPSDVQVTDRIWGHFVWACFVEDLWTARQWRAVAAPLGDPLERGDAGDPGVQANRARFLEQLATWTPRMSPLLEFFPSGLSHFTSQQGREGQRLTLLATHRIEGVGHDVVRSAVPSVATGAWGPRAG